MKQPTTWQEILSEPWEESSEQYGPHTHAVWNALEAIADMPSLDYVGEPIDDDRIVRVTSWDDAFQMFYDSDGRKYGPNGHLVEPVRRARAIIESPDRGPWWKQARGDVIKYVGLDAYVPKSLEQAELPGRHQSQYSALYEYLYEFISWLLAEIIGSDVVGSTYFREQLEWFVAGHLPCGWEGDWPAGKMRVF